MAYSSIIKKCKCGCDRMPAIFFEGYSYQCAPEEVRERVVQKKIASKKKSEQTKRLKNKIRKLGNEVETEKDLERRRLDLFFEMVAKEIEKKPYCWETGEFISKTDYRNATAHIFPKAIFKSISTHPMNYLVLSARNGSHDKTHRLDTFSKMKVWRLAVERFKIFEHEIKERHKYLDLFKSYVT